MCRPIRLVHGSIEHWHFDQQRYVRRQFFSISQVIFKDKKVEGFLLDFLFLHVSRFLELPDNIAGMLAAC